MVHSRSPALRRRLARAFVGEAFKYTLNPPAFVVLPAEACDSYLGRALQSLRREVVGEEKQRAEEPSRASA